MAISRYRSLRVLKNEEGVSYFETLELPNININAIPHIVVSYSQGDRLDLLADKHLGNGAYWWIIALVNKLSWPWGIPYGTLLKIPNSVEQILDLF